MVESVLCYKSESSTMKENEKWKLMTMKQNWNKKTKMVWPFTLNKWWEMVRRLFTWIPNGRNKIVRTKECGKSWQWEISKDKWHMIKNKTDGNYWVHYDLRIVSTIAILSKVTPRAIWSHFTTYINFNQILSISTDLKMGILMTSISHIKIK